MALKNGERKVVDLHIYVVLSCSERVCDHIQYYSLLKLLMLFCLRSVYFGFVFFIVLFILWSGKAERIEWGDLGKYTKTFATRFPTNENQNFFVSECFL